MNKLFLTFLALLAITTAASVPGQNLNEDDLADGPQIRKNGISGRGIILSSKGKKAVIKFINHLKTGWPEDGIPPLAPYTNDQMVFKMKEPFFEIDLKVENFIVSGLDNVQIRTLDIGYALSQSVEFNFLLPKITVSGRLLTDSYIDLLDRLGLKISFNSEGDFDLVFENIVFQGYFKYKMPILFGSCEIYKFNASITLGNVVSLIDGILGNGKLNLLLNDKVEDILMEIISSNQEKISARLEEILVPFANEKLKGSNIWTVIG